VPRTTAVHGIRNASTAIDNFCDGAEFRAVASPWPITRRCPGNGDGTLVRSTATGVVRPAISTYDDVRLLGGVDVGPVYLLTGPDPGLVVYTGLSGTEPIQFPVGVTAGGAELSSFTTSSPSKP
jgi:hypothetical protein